MVNGQDCPGAGDVHSLLRQIIAEDGIDVIGDRDRIRELLQESPALASRETLALAEAAGLGIPAELRAQDGAATIPMAVVAADLARRLQQDAGLADEVSRWAVATWAGHWASAACRVLRTVPSLVLWAWLRVSPSPRCLALL
jgi:hypothetical protein